MAVGLGFGAADTLTVCMLLRTAKRLRALVHRECRPGSLAARFQLRSYERGGSFAAWLPRHGALLGDPELDLCVSSQAAALAQHLRTLARQPMQLSDISVEVMLSRLLTAAMAGQSQLTSIVSAPRATGTTATVMRCLPAPLPAQLQQHVVDADSARDQVFTPLAVAHLSKPQAAGDACSPRQRRRATQRRQSRRGRSCRCGAAAAGVDAAHSAAAAARTAHASGAAAIAQRPPAAAAPGAGRVRQRHA